jgi:hypothetical protein
MMKRYYDKAAWLLSSLGIALLVCGLILVPQSRLLADDGGGDGTRAVNCVWDCTCTGNTTPCSQVGFVCINYTDCRTACKCANRINGQSGCYCVDASPF